jgi:hypothetical protein
MAATRTAIAMEFESKRTAPRRYVRYACNCHPKPGLSRKAVFSLLLCLPATGMLWAAIIYGALKLVR